MTSTVLQPAIFMQNIAGYWAAVIEQDCFLLPCSVYAEDAYVDYRDVAEVAALALTGDMLDNGTFELCATGMMNRMEIALMMSEVLGLNVGSGVVPFEEWAPKACLPEGLLKDGLKRMFAFYDDRGFRLGTHACCERSSAANLVLLDSTSRSWQGRERHRSRPAC